MRGNTVTIEMAEKRGKMAKTIPLYQFDYGQRLIIIVPEAELPTSYEVNFSNELHGEAVTMIGDSTGVDIPDTLLTTGLPVYLWLFLHDGEDDGETEYAGVVPVIKRAETIDDPPTPEQQSAITQAIAALNAAVEQTALDVAAAGESVTAAETAQGKAEDAQEAAETAQGKAEDAQEAAETAQGKAEDAQEAAETAQGKAEDAQEAAEAAQTAAETAETNAQKWATGGTSGTPSATNNAKYYSEQAADSASDAAASAAAAAEMIDDTAGIGGTDVTWSADNLAKKFSNQDTMPYSTALDYSNNEYILRIKFQNYTEREGAVFPIVLKHGRAVQASACKISFNNGTARNLSVPGSGSVTLANGVYMITCSKSGGNFVYSMVADGINGKVNGITVRTAAGKYVNTSEPSTPSDDYVPSTKLMYEELAKKYEKPQTGIPASDLASGVIPDVSGFYTKPAGGIPASDIADGVIPDPEDLIDDEAGEGDTDKVWSADKSAEEVSTLNGAINAKADEPTGTKSAGKVYGLNANLEPEWTTPQSGGGVSDVQVDGTSVVTNGVANIPMASNATMGAILLGDGFSTDNSTKKTKVDTASADNVKAGASQKKCLTPYQQHRAAFYGLASAAGDSTQSASNNAVGIYTESAKSAIASMLEAPETVSGTTPSITAKAGVRYICGEVATLTIVVPASGIIDVTFDSGSTPTVLTVTPPTGMTMKWANGFDPTSFDANTTYEINIMDGCYGVVGKWT